MNVEDAAKELREIAAEHPDAELKIDPPYSDVLGVSYRPDRDVVEVRH